MIAELLRSKTFKQIADENNINVPVAFCFIIFVQK